MVSLKEMTRLDAKRAPPAWLHRLLETSFFEACPKHPAGTGHANKRNAGCNFFCNRCTTGALSSGCLDDHAGHELIQIRRSSGNNLLRVEDVKHLLNMSLVQTYLNNGVDAVFLNKRPMLRHGRPGASRCEECERGLQDEFCRFCSIGCKATGIEDGLDFSVSFAVDPNIDSSDKSEAEDNDDNDSSRPTKFQKLGSLSASSSKQVTPR